ncbi:MAG: 2'-deoxycytidine 5'-triphosphate deaminase [Planctomycetota bacterium]|nr:MAG: 2'-deoxycytidine 5'-triphosphate deaminase [Planctomycetota bacterium]
MNGLLTRRQIDALRAQGAIRLASDLDPTQCQPTTLDLRLGEHALAIEAGFLPRGGSVKNRAASLARERLDLREGAVLKRGQVYLVPLLESLALPEGLRARANPRSSTGRIDVFTRLLVDGGDRFDDVPAGYTGPLWVEVLPRSFDVRVRTGLRLNQLRFLRGDPLLRDDELAQRVLSDDLLPGSEAPPIHNASLLLGLSVRAESPGAPIGWRARHETPVLDLTSARPHDPHAFFEPVFPDQRDGLILQPEAFYILASSERVRVPPDLAAEMLPWDVGMGELRTNYAGFFDPGFGWGPAAPSGAAAVLEVRPHDVPFHVEHGQAIFRLQFSRTVEPAAQLYGEGGSAYQNQGLQLARYFAQP